MDGYASILDKTTFMTRYKSNIVIDSTGKQCYDKLSLSNILKQNCNEWLSQYCKSNANVMIRYQKAKLEQTVG